jgi:PAS domain S-box-containing protein
MTTNPAGEPQAEVQWRKLAMVASRTDNGVIITDAAGRVEWVNDGFTRLTGYDLADMIGRIPGQVLQGPLTDPTTREQMRRGVETGSGFSVDVQNYRKDGSQLWISMQVRPVHDDAGRLYQFIGIGMDVTERRRQEQALRTSEDRFRSIVNTAQEGIWLIDHEACTTFVNRRMATMLGYEINEMLGKPMYAFMDAAAIKDAEHNFQRRREGIAENHDFRLLHRDGSDLWTMMATNPVFGDGGVFHGALALVTDITARRASEGQLAAAHAENELILQTITTGLIGLDINERISRWNQAAERIFALTKAQVVGKPLGECGIDLEWADLLPAMNTCLEEGHPVDLPGVHFRRPDGTEGTLDITIVSSWSAHGDGSEGLGMILMVSDSTQRKLAALQKNHSQKLESIGQLAAGVAHEINTPIQFIGDNLRFLGDSFGDLTTVLAAYAELLAICRQPLAALPTLAPAITTADAAIKRADVTYLAQEIPKAINQSLEGVTRVADIVRAMKEFSHPDQGEKKPSDLNKAIKTTLTVARNEYKYVADLVTDLADDLPTVPCIVGEFSQVVLNLVVNAAHAISDVVAGHGGRGTITVSTRLEVDHVAVRIRDTGTGIPASAQAKIFDPFFTTKGVGKGTGQGLYIAHTVVAKKHGGSLTFETEAGVGTTFIIRLPLHARSA